MLAALPDPAAEVRLRQALVAEAYEDGFADGLRAGLEEAWSARERHALVLLDGPTLEELERARWGAAGRAHAGDPRPGDRHPRRLGRAS